MNRIENKFKELHKINKKAFIAFIMAGDPNIKTTYELVLEFERAGVDIIELGIPFSDPTADGPVIQEAGIRALKNNTNLQDVLALVKSLRKKTNIPIVLMSYYNPIFHFGDERFISLAKASGVDGLIIVDAIPEELSQLIKKARDAEINTIFFVSPTTTPQRAQLINKLSRGFIYCVSLTGVTGVRQTLPKELIQQLHFLKKTVKKPICVGFGISNPTQVKEISKFSDGVIVGSAIMQKIKDNLKDESSVKKVGRFVEGLVKPLCIQRLN